MPTACYIGLEEVDGYKYIMGDVFMRGYYVVFSFDNYSVGIANNFYNPPSNYVSTSSLSSDAFSFSATQYPLTQQYLIISLVGLFIGILAVIGMALSCLKSQKKGKKINKKFGSEEGKEQLVVNF